MLREFIYDFKPLFMAKFTPQPRTESTLVIIQFVLEKKCTLCSSLVSWSIVIN